MSRVESRSLALSGDGREYMGVGSCCGFGKSASWITSVGWDEGVGVGRCGGGKKVWMGRRCGVRRRCGGGKSASWITSVGWEEDVGVGRRCGGGKKV